MIAPAPTLGQLVDQLGVNLEALVVVAKRVPKVTPNGTLQSAVDRMREVKAMLAAVQPSGARR